MIRDLAIYGAGGFGREIALMVSQINQINRVWNVIGFFDDGLLGGTEVDGLKVLGGLNELNRHKSELALVLAVAEPEVRERLFDSVTHTQVDYPTLVHPGALIGDPMRNTLGRGCLIAAGVILTTGIHLGDFVIVNLSTTIGHDAQLGSFSSLMPGCSLSGRVTIGKKVAIGTGARILQNLSVGDESVVGAGAVITRSFPARSKLIGVPARNQTP